MNYTDEFGADTRGPCFTIKDSGKRAEFSGGMVRDTDEGKPRPDLVRDGPMLWRWITHLTNGAQKYSPRNWMKATGADALMRGYESADRHYEQWRRGDTDEDHAAAVFFNINLVEHLKEKLDATGIVYYADQPEAPGMNNGPEHVDLGERYNDGSLRPAHERWPNGAPT